MKTVNQSDFGEDLISFSSFRFYYVTCPYCNETTETRDDPNYETELDCEHCNETFEIVQQ